MRLRGFGAAPQLPPMAEVRGGLVVVSDKAYKDTIEATEGSARFVAELTSPDGELGRLEPEVMRYWLAEQATLGNAVLVYVHPTHTFLSPFEDRNIAVTKSPKVVATMAGANNWESWAVVQGPEAVLKEALQLAAAQPKPASPPAPSPTPPATPQAPPLVSKSGFGIVGWAAMAALGVVGLALLWRSSR